MSGISIENSTKSSYLQFAEEAVKTLYKKRATDIRMYELGEDSPITDCYIICTGRSSAHIASLADSLSEEMGKVGRAPYRVEGRGGASWTLCDYGDFIVHIFDRESREFYNLDRLLDQKTVRDISYIIDSIKEDGERS